MTTNPDKTKITSFNKPWQMIAGARKSQMYCSNTLYYVHDTEQPLLSRYSWLWLNDILVGNMMHLLKGSYIMMSYTSCGHSVQGACPCIVLYAWLWSLAWWLWGDHLNSNITSHKWMLKSKGIATYSEYKTSEYMLESIIICTGS